MLGDKSTWHEGRIGVPGVQLEDDLRGDDVLINRITEPWQQLVVEEAPLCALEIELYGSERGRGVFIQRLVRAGGMKADGEGWAKGGEGLGTGEGPKDLELIREGLCSTH